MVRVLLFFALYAAASAAEPAPPHVPFKTVPFPAQPAGVAELDLAAIEARIATFDQVAGGYPPRLKEEQRERFLGAWTETVFAARRLQESEPDSPHILAALAALYRQGHNIEVAECGSHAVALLTDGLKRFPDSIPLNRQASYFFLQIDPRFASRGEEALLTLRRLLGQDTDPEVERGLVLAYLYQDKLDAAKQQAARFLRLFPEDEEMRRLEAALREGKVRRKSM